jgi:ArsR family transcriptional regulator
VPERIPLPEAAWLFRVLADETRLRLLLLLSERGEVSGADLAAAVGLSSSAVSNHLALLRRAGVAIRRRKGERFYFYLASPFVAELLRDITPG